MAIPIIGKETMPYNSLGGGGGLGGAPVAGAVKVGVPMPGQGGLLNPQIWELGPGSDMTPTKPFANPTAAQISGQNSPILAPPTAPTAVSDFWGAPAVGPAPTNAPAPGTTLGAGETGAGGYGSAPVAQTPLPASTVTAPPAPGTTLGAGQTGVGGYGGATGTTKPATVADKNKAAIVQDLAALYGGQNPYGNVNGIINVWDPMRGGSNSS